MKNLLTPLALSALMLAGFAQPALAKPAAAAPAVASGGVNGIAVANPEAILVNTNAYKTAQAQRPVTYKPQIDQYNARGQQIEAQLRPLGEKFIKDRDTAGFPPATLQQEYAAIQQVRESAKAELAKIMEPVQLSEAYVQEQINDKFLTAAQAAMSKAGVTLLINPQNVVWASNAYNLNQQILDELNVALPSAQLVPPAGWLPREQREAQAQQAAAQAGARGTAAPADGR